jgi:hypothetical protein
MADKPIPARLDIMHGHDGCDIDAEPFGGRVEIGLRQRARQRHAGHGRAAFGAVEAIDDQMRAGLVRSQRLLGRGAEVARDRHGGADVIEHILQHNHIGTAVALTQQAHQAACWW